MSSSNARAVNSSPGRVTFGCSQSLAVACLFTRTFRDHNRTLARREKQRSHCHRKRQGQKNESSVAVRSAFSHGGNMYVTLQMRACRARRRGKRELMKNQRTVACSHLSPTGCCECSTWTKSTGDETRAVDKSVVSFCST